MFIPFVSDVRVAGDNGPTNSQSIDIDDGKKGLERKQLDENQ